MRAWTAPIIGKYQENTEGIPASGPSDHFPQAKVLTCAFAKWDCPRDPKIMFAFSGKIWYIYFGQMYATCVYCLDSCPLKAWLDENYTSQPWERIADYLGGVYGSYLPGADMLGSIYGIGTLIHSLVIPF